MKRFESITKPMMWSTTILLAAIVAGCGGSGDGVPGPGSGPIGSTCSGTGCVNLGTAGNYVILSKAGISTTGATAVTGNLGVSPIDRTGLTGFSETMHASNVYSTSTYVTGKLYASDYAVPTPANLTTAVSNMETAFTTANGLSALGGTVNGVPGVVCPGVGILNAITIGPGVYKCDNPVSITGAVTLSGAGVYVFQFAQTLDQDPSTQVGFANGAVAQNVFWVVTQGVSIGTGATMQGVILGKTLIAVTTGATVKGRLLAQTEVTLDANMVTAP